MSWATNVVVLGLTSPGSGSWVVWLGEGALRTRLRIGVVVVARRPKKSRSRRIVSVRVVE
jgi:hypothetical protein